MEFARIRPARLLSVLCALLFSICMVFVYIYWLSPSFDYMGFPLATDGTGAIWVGGAIILVGAMTLPLKIVRFSDFFLWMIFYAVYVPSLLFVPLQGLLPDDGLLLVCVLGISFSMFQLMSTYRIALRQLAMRRSSLVIGVFGVYAALNIYALVGFSGHLRIAGLADLYAQRDVAADVTTGSFVGYAIGLLSGAFNPFLMTVGLFERRRAWYLLGVAGQMFMYATYALKQVFLSIFFITIIYLLIRRRPQINSVNLGFVFVAGCLATLALIPLVDAAADGIVWHLVSLVFMRAFGTSGTLTGVYAEFFSTHPLTYYSHINLIANFVHFPYAQSVGEEIGYYLVNGPLDDNANFWATDGIAAAGYVGVIIIALFMGGFLITMNSVLRSYGQRLAMVAFLPFIVNVANNSLFMSLFSGGGAALLLLLCLWEASTASRTPAVGPIGNGQVQS